MLIEIVHSFGIRNVNVWTFFISTILAYPQNQPLPTVKTNIGGPAPTVQYTTCNGISLFSIL